MIRSTGNGPILHGTGIIHVVTTYVGEFTCAFRADREMMPDPGFYAECMLRSFDELLAAARSPRPASVKQKAT
jgi:diacylglycerol O-acyltransferase / wax synthase